MFFCLTMDSDWAPPEVIAHALDVVRPSATPCTLFLTEDAPPSNADGGPERDLRVEIALHPFFNGRDPAEVLAPLLARHPQARGLRPHRLSMPPEHCARAVRASGARWVSSHADSDALALKRWDGDIPDAPIHWGDNTLLRLGQRPSLSGLDPQRPGLAVFNFHPVHIFLNTCDQEQYERARPAYHDPERLRSLRNATRFGVRDALLELLEQLEQRPALAALTLSQAVEALA